MTIHIFNHSACFTRLLLYVKGCCSMRFIHFWELTFDQMSFVFLSKWYNVISYCSNFSQAIGTFELASTITLVLQTSRLTKCDDHREHRELLATWNQIPSSFYIFKDVNIDYFIGSLINECKLVNPLILVW